MPRNTPTVPPIVRMRVDQLALPYALLISRFFLSFFIRNLAVSALTRTWIDRIGRRVNQFQGQTKVFGRSEKRPSRTVPFVVLWCLPSHFCNFF